ncbi:hypothetical protein TrRE_jg9319, partial [Triparma retinervis]
MPQATLAEARTHFMKKHHVQSQLSKPSLGSFSGSFNASSNGFFEGSVPSVPSSMPAAGGTLMRTFPPVSEIQRGTEERIETVAAEISEAANREPPQRMAAPYNQGSQGQGLDLSTSMEQQLPLLDEDDASTTSNFIRENEAMFSQLPVQQVPSAPNTAMKPTPMDTLQRSPTFHDKSRQVENSLEFIEAVKTEVGDRFDGGGGNSAAIEGEEEEEDDPEDTCVKYGRFSIRTGVPESRSDLPKSIMFIPESKQNKNEHYPELVKKIWGMGEANMILKLCAGSRHPKVLVNSLLAETPGYMALKKEASVQVKRKQKLLKKRLAKPTLIRRHRYPDRGSSRVATPSSKSFEVGQGEEADVETVVDHTGAHSSPSPPPLASPGSFNMSRLVRQASNISKISSNYNVYRFDESGFSSGNSSSSSDSLSSSSSSDSETEEGAGEGEGAPPKNVVDKLRKRRRKHRVRPPKSLAIDNMDDDDDDGLGVNMGGDFLPFSLRKVIVADTRDKSNIESIISKMLFERMVSCYVTVVESSAQANNWILVDRTSPDHSPTAELLLEYALHRTQATPVIIVIDSMSRFLGAPKANKIAREQGQKLLNMREFSQYLKKVEDMHTAVAANASNCEEIQIQSLRDLSDFDNWRDFVTNETLPFDPEEHQKQ